MLEIGKTYEYEYMHQDSGKPRDFVKFEVMDYIGGMFEILIGQEICSIDRDSPIAWMAEEVENVPT